MKKAKWVHMFVSQTLKHSAEFSDMNLFIQDLTPTQSLKS